MHRWRILGISGGRALSRVLTSCLFCGYFKSESKMQLTGVCTGWLIFVCQEHTAFFFCCFCTLSCFLLYVLGHYHSVSRSVIKQAWKDSRMVWTFVLVLLLTSTKTGELDALEARLSPASRLQHLVSYTRSVPATLHLSTCVSSRHAKLQAFPTESQTASNKNTL